MSVAHVQTKRPSALISVNEADGIAVVCAWCAGKNEADAWGLAHGLKLSHSMCPRCHDAFVEQVRCERASRNPFKG